MHHPARAFEAAFGGPPDGVWRAPGRVNLIGEHTDYNDGFVLPIAIDRGTQVAARARDDDLVRCVSAAAGEAPVVPLRALRASAGWPAYVHGPLALLHEEHGLERGLDLFVDSDVPPGAGLSSSAALECAVALAGAGLGEIELTPQRIARLAQRAEREIVGVPCGPMDQTVSMLARARHALLLDTRSMQTEHIPFDPESSRLRLLVIDTRVKHALVEGAYARRQRECADAARALDVAALRDASRESVERAALEGTLRRRALHVVTENERVGRAVMALGAGDVRALGALFLESHSSLRDLYEVSSPELDAAVDAAMAAGAVGARMTGGGFGGSAIALVPAQAEEAVATACARAFETSGWLTPNVWAVSPAGGAARVG